ncbi:MAG: UDP-N-acetylmuramoyl-L-alanyl-D-glutamate--2,6-diaminopimelate ligase [Muribaculaceae bacterium]
MEKTLKLLLQDIKPLKIVGPDHVTITDVVNDSRKVTKGSLFVAVNGVAVDAHRFIPDVVAAGAAAVVCEHLPAEINPNVTYVMVDNSTISLACIAQAWYDYPSEKVILVGVTGTNGKTTTATLLYEMAEMMGYKAGLISTVQNIIHKTAYEAKQTTPDALSLAKLLSDMADAGCQYAFMEVSSHSCVQHRIVGLHFAGGIFSNLTRDHLDFHKTVDNYINAKKSFFDSLQADAFAITNIDDKQGLTMTQNTKAQVRTYSLRALADYKCRIVESRLNGTSLNINGQDIEVMFTGRFNAYNLTAVYGACLMLGWPADQVLVNMSMLVPVAGRFQTFLSPRGYTAVVDYAHTPDAIVNVLQSIKEVVGTKGQIITVVGCGGNRDAGKRPIMAREAAARSQRLILTSDNPRFEDPQLILQQMQAGLTPDDYHKTLTIADRREAIRTACQLANPGDVVLVAGKGHETYQEVQGVKHHFDDREVINQVFDHENVTMQ